MRDDLVPDFGEAQRFMNLLFGGEDKPACFQVFKNSNGYEGVPEWKYGTLKELRSWLANKNREGAGIYVMVNEGDGKGRKAENVTAVRAVFVDLDGSPLGPVRSAQIKPHLITESSPGRYQAFWRVEGAQPHHFPGLQKAMAERFESDPAVCDPPRVMRLPGFYHLKGEPFMSKIIEANPGEPYPIRHVTSGLRLTPRPEAERRHMDKANLPSDDFEVPKGQRNRTLVSAIARLRNAGLSGESLLEATRRWNLDHCRPPLPDKEVVRAFEWGNNLEGGTIKPARYTPGDPVFGNKANKALRKSQTWRELQHTEIAPVKWIVKDLLPEGLCILSGRPKAGKSWLIQGLCLAVAEGGEALGRFACNQGISLSISLEDTDRRFKGRMLTILGGKEAPLAAYFNCEWPRLPEAASTLESWVKDHPGTKLVVIDTLAKIRPQPKWGNKGNSYDTDYGDIGALQSLAGRHQMAIVLVHHLRKGETEDDVDSVSGTAGITGAADTIWILRRPDRQKMVGQLIITGRDIADRKYALRFDDGRGLWLCEGLSSEVAGTELQNRVLAAMGDLGRPASAQEVADQIGVNRGSVYRAIEALVKDGLLHRSVGQKGKYVPAVGVTNATDYAALYDDRPVAE